MTRLSGLQVAVARFAGYEPQVCFAPGCRGRGQCVIPKANAAELDDEELITCDVCRGVGRLWQRLPDDPLAEIAESPITEAEMIRILGV